MVDTKQKKHLKLIFWLLLASFTFAAAVLYFGLIAKKSKKPMSDHIQISGVFLPVAKEIHDFNLTDNHGQPFNKEKMKGHWTMMFFGFTNCGYVCPTTLAELSKMYQILQTKLPDRLLPQIVLVSVDPERDSVERMNSYVSAFNPHFIGARADLSETVALENQLHISAVKMEAKGKGKNHYMINHSAEILLFNPNAQVQAYFSFPQKADILVKDYQLILNSIDF